MGTTLHAAGRATGRMVGARATPRARTLLEKLIRDRQFTFEEFAEYAERFAREHGESGR